MLAAITLVMGELEPGVQCDMGLPLCLVAITILFVSRCSQVDRAEGLFIRLGLALFSLSVCFFLLPILKPLLQRRGVLKQVGFVHLQKSEALPV